ncbi:MAG: hypothetical protein JRJ65_14415 [Deltaproteobacteria bacterium]|nr:hypothetical protein [Deltaproteobacteria bacterium]
MKLPAASYRVFRRRRVNSRFLPHIQPKEIGRSYQIYREVNDYVWNDRQRIGRKKLEMAKFKKIIKYLFSVFPVVSVREITPATCQVY